MKRVLKILSVTERHRFSTLVLHKSRVRKSNVRLSLINFFFFSLSSISYDCRTQSNSSMNWARLRSIGLDSNLVRLGSIYFAGLFSPESSGSDLIRNGIFCSKLTYTNTFQLKAWRHDRFKFSLLLRLPYTFRSGIFFKFRFYG